jgi:RNA polymerase sigma factor (sigma-70 family)
VAEIRSGSQELLQAYKDGDVNAFTDFYNRHYNDVTKWVEKCFRLTHADIEVAVQSAFMALAKREVIPDHPLVYLQQSSILRAKTIKSRKKRHEEKFTPITGVTNDGKTVVCERFSAHIYAPENQEIDIRDETSVLDRAIATLAPKEREVVAELRKDNNISQVSKKLGLRWETVKSRRDKAIAKLKPLLA